MGQVGSIRRHLATTHQCFIFFAIKISLTCGRAFIVFISSFCAKTPGSQNLAGIDFASVYRKSFICSSRHSVDLRPISVVPKVRESSLNVPRVIFESPRRRAKYVVSSYCRSNDAARRQDSVVVPVNFTRLAMKSDMWETAGHAESKSSPRFRRSAVSGF